VANWRNENLNFGRFFWFWLNLLIFFSCQFLLVRRFDASIFCCVNFNILYFLIIEILQKCDIYFIISVIQLFLQKVKKKYFVQKINKISNLIKIKNYEEFMKFKSENWKRGIKVRRQKRLSTKNAAVPEKKIKRGNYEKNVASKNSSSLLTVPKKKSKPLKICSNVFFATVYQIFVLHFCLFCNFFVSIFQLL